MDFNNVTTSVPGISERIADINANNDILNEEASTMFNNISFEEINIRITTPIEIATTFVSIFAIFVNFCVLLVIFIGPRAFRTPTFLFISCLATADLLTGTSVLLAIFLPVQDGVWERIALKGICVVSFSASVNNLILIAGDRYLKIHDETRYNRVFTQRNAGVLMTLTWMLAIFVFLVAPLLGWSCANGMCECPNDAMCNCNKEYCSQSFTPFTKSYLIFGVSYFYASLLIMVILYSALFFSVRGRVEARRYKGSVVGPTISRGPFVTIHRRREIQLAKTLVIVMTVFFVCWLPVTTLFIFDIARGQPTLIKWFDYCLISAVIHPLVNPIIYSLRLPRMWRTFKYLAYALWRRIFRKSKRGGNFRRPSSLHNSDIGLRRGDSIVTSIVSRTSIKRRVELQRKSTSASVKTNISRINESPTSDSSSEPSEFTDIRTGPRLTRSHSTNAALRRDLHRQKSENSKPVHECRFKRRPRSMNRTVRLSNGDVVPKETVRISQPFNTEQKMTWDY